MNSLVEAFAKVFKTTVEDWEFWKDEHYYTGSLIITGPSRIVGLVDLTKLGADIEWKTYIVKSVPTKKMTGSFVYDGGLYGVTWLRDIFKMLGEAVEVSRYKEGLLFKLNEGIAIALAERIDCEGFYYNDEGVMFIDCEWEETKDEWKTVTTAKEFIKWDNNVAYRKHTSKNLTWLEYVYKWEYFFEKEQEMGDFLDL